MSLQDPHFSSLNPYTLACGIVSASRQVAQLEPGNHFWWPPELVTLTGLQLAHFVSVHQALIQGYYQKFVEPEMMRQQRIIVKSSVPRNAETSDDKENIS